MRLVSELLTTLSRNRIPSLILTRLWENDDELHGPNHRIYREALQSFVDHGQEIHHVRHMFFWLMKLRDPIVVLLHKRNFTARLIFFPYAIGMKFLKDMWFVGNAGELLSRELIDPRESVPPRLVYTVESIRNEFMK